MKNEKGVNELLSEATRKMNIMTARQLQESQQRLELKKLDPTALSADELVRKFAVTTMSKSIKSDPLSAFPVSLRAYKWLVQLRNLPKMGTKETWKYISEIWPDLHDELVRLAKVDKYQLTLGETRGVLFSMYPLAKALESAAISRRNEAAHEASVSVEAPKALETVAAMPPPGVAEAVSSVPHTETSNGHCRHKECTQVIEKWTVRVNDCNVPEKVGYCARHTHMRMAIAEKRFWGTSEEADEYLEAMRDSAHLMPAFE